MPLCGARWPAGRSCRRRLYAAYMPTFRGEVVFARGGRGVAGDPSARGRAGEDPRNRDRAQGRDQRGQSRASCRGGEMIGVPYRNDLPVRRARHAATRADADAPAAGAAPAWHSDLQGIHAAEPRPWSRLDVEQTRSAFRGAPLRVQEVAASGRVRPPSRDSVVLDRTRRMQTFGVVCLGHNIPRRSRGSSAMCAVRVQNTRDRDRVFPEPCLLLRDTPSRTRATTCPST